MKLKIDTGKVYAIALEGGGARGAYQVGVWKALEEAGIRYNAVSGSSVGSLNGAFMAMNRRAEAERLWNELTFSKIMNIDDELMDQLLNMRPEITGRISELFNSAKNVIAGGGFDVKPLKELICSAVDEQAIRRSDKEFYIVTYSVDDRKELELRAKDLGREGQIHEMLLASAYFPAFKHEKLGGRRYTDGGVQDVVPIHILLDRGFRDLIVLRIYGVGVERKVKIPEDANIVSIGPKKDLGSVMNFSHDKICENMRLGYFDGKRALYGLYGNTYYIDRTMTEDEAYGALAAVLGREGASLRELNEQLIPEEAKRLGVPAEGDYYDVLIALMEDVAQRYGIDPFAIHTDREFMGLICVWKKRGEPQKEKGFFDILADIGNTIWNRSES